MDWVKLIAAVLAGMAVCIPLAIKLVQYVQANARAKNYTALVSLVTRLMEQAERMFDEGADKKEWALAMVEASAKSINFDVDMDAVADMIDALAEMSKAVNAPETEDEAV